jgi:hypothetical protein
LQNQHLACDSDYLAASVIMPSTARQGNGNTSAPPKDAIKDPKQQEALKEIEGQTKKSANGERYQWSFERRKSGN